MASPPNHVSALTRRRLLQQLAASPLLLRSFAANGEIRTELSGLDAKLSFSPTRYTPVYPVRSPLEDVLKLVPPGLDEFASERTAAELERSLGGWESALKEGRFAQLEQDCAPDLVWSSLTPAHQVQKRSAHGVDCFAYDFAGVAEHGAAAFVSALAAWLGAHPRVENLEFEITSLSERPGTPLAVDTEVRFSLVAQVNDTMREQRSGTWQMQWRQERSGWRVTRFKPLTESRGVLHGRGFVDVTKQALGGVPSYAQQMQRGTDHWRTVLDGACGIDVYGNNGVAVGDFDRDGLDDLYVSQPAGLPNRLYHNRGDGTFEDVTERAGVGVLDNTACALFADLRNCGWQDLLVVTGGGPLLFLNQGDGTFTLKGDAFQFARPPQGTFTHAAIADYDRDGRLDIYFCLYSYYLGLDQYHYPAPYFDARNGPPNFLLHNQGDGTFLDRTEAAGLNAENDRYSFACAWVHTADGKGPNLSVVNDFGRNNLYRRQDDGTFRAVSTEAHIEDVGAGMSACWNDYDNDGKPDLYVANMWSAAGQRISHQGAFHPQSTAATRDLYQRHACGNALYRNQGNGLFANVSATAGVERGRWAWGSDFWDFDHDGFADLYVTNGYITPPRPTANGPSRDTPDLASFFWRQVVAKSPDDATPSPAYEHGWNALNESIRADGSWSGAERNVFFANNGDGTFSDVSGALGMDFLEDGRSFALTDLDGDGRLEVIVKNRNAPQLRILHNAMEQLGDSIAFRLRGTKSNRDAIGTVITVKTGSLQQCKAVEAGSGFLSQHTKELLFGLGHGSEAIHATVLWPSGLTQSLEDLPRNARIELEEDRPTFTAKPFSTSAKLYTTAHVPSADNVERPVPTSFGTWLLDPIQAPPFSLPDAVGTSVALAFASGRNLLLSLCASSQPASARMLDSLDRAFAGLKAVHIDVIALDVDSSAAMNQANCRRAFPVLSATDEIAGIYNILFRYLFDRRANLPLPTSLLLDERGRIVKVYQGELSLEEVRSDTRMIPGTTEERIRRALPFPGTLYQSTFQRNEFTYGVAMFQHGYLDQAAISFEQVIAIRPDDAEAYYNLGTLDLRRNDFSKARQQLEKALTLKPNYPEAWNNLGMMAAQQGQTAEAMHSFEKSLALRPAYLTALLNLGNLYRHERSFINAQTYLVRALTQAPEDAEANYSMGMLYAQQGQMEPAAEYLQHAIALRPDYAEARNNLGVLYVREQRYAEAEQQLQTCIRLVPSFANTYLNLAQLYLVQHDRERARAILNDLLKLQPENATARQALQAVDRAP